jgi:hypothetical protein
MFLDTGDFTMKRGILILACTGFCCALCAEPAEEFAQEEAPVDELADATIEIPLQLEEATPPEAKWIRAEYGILGQMAQAPNPLAPINPLEPQEAGYGEGNVSTDTVTGRVMGLRFLKFEF